MRKTYLELPGWEFHIREATAGFYEIVGRDRLGHRVCAEGPEVELDSLLERCRMDAVRIAGAKGHGSA